MNRALRIGTACAVAALTVPLSASPSWAEPVSEVPTSAAYFYQFGQIDTGTEAGKLPANPGGDTDGVAPGNLAVAAEAGKIDKASYLFFPLDPVVALGEGTTITTAILTVPLVEKDAQNDVRSADPAKVRVCAIDDKGFGNEDAANLATAPGQLCDEFEAPATPSADGKAYTFDITPLAQTWVTMNNGLALTVAKGAETTRFQVVFAAGPSATLAYDFTPPAGTDTGSTDVFVEPVPTDSGSTDTGSTDLGGGFDSGTGGDTGSTAPVDTAGFGSVESPLVSTGSGAVTPPAPTTAAAEPTVAAPPVRRVAFSERLDPTLSFFVAGLLLAAALAFLSMIMGDPRVPAANTRPSRLSTALQARQRGQALPALGRTPGA